MEPLTQDQVVEIIEPHKQELISCVQSGITDYFQKYAPFLHEHSMRSRTSLIYDNMALHARARFAGKPDTYIFEDKNDSVIVVVQEQVSIRFKKFRKNKRVANIRTKQALKYCEQQTLDGIPSTINLFVGYLPDPAFRGVDGIFLTCPKNYYGNLWVIPLVADELTRATVPMAFENGEPGLLPARIKLKTQVENAAAS